MSDKSGEKKNLYCIRYGNADGELKMGHVTGDNEITAFLIRSGYFYDHYIDFGATGDRSRAGGTICKSPGAFQVKAGSNCGVEDNAIFMMAENGDIHLSAPQGKVIIDAKNILLKASGEGGGNGKITIEGNESVELNGHGDGVSIDGNASVKIKSEKEVDIIGGAITNIYGGSIDMADGNGTSVAGKPSKTGIKAASAVGNLIDTFTAGLGGAILSGITGIGDLEQQMKSGTFSGFLGL
jgi:hypothetical protein